MNKSLAVLLTVALLFTASGATCLRSTYPNDPLAPVAFTAAPTLEDIIYTVNANTDRVQQLHTENASLSLAGMVGSLKASISVERPQRFRLRAKLFGPPEVDLGSNDELFWFWAKSSPQPAIYYARHSEYANAAASQLLPVAPSMLIEAFGLVWIEPGGQHEGPFPRADGKVEIRSRLNGGGGAASRVIVVDDRYGWITEQHVFDVSGNVLASVRASGHRHYPQVGASLPHNLEVTMSGAGQTLRIDVGEYWLNQQADPGQWAMPQLPGYPPVNVASPQFQPQQALSLSPPGGFQPPLPQPRAAMLPAYRGHSVSHSVSR